MGGARDGASGRTGSEGHDGTRGAAAAEPVDASRGARRLAAVVLGLGILLAVVGLARPALHVALDEAVVPVTVEEPGAILGDEPEGLPADSRLELADERAFELVVAGLPAWQRALTGLGAAVGGLLVLTGAWLVRSMLLLVAAGRPFDPRVPGRLRGLALVVAASVLLPAALAGLAGAIVVEGLGGLGGTGALGVDLFALEVLPLLVAALLAVAAQVVESGRRLTEELEGLV